MNEQGSISSISVMKNGPCWVCILGKGGVIKGRQVCVCVCVCVENTYIHVYKTLIK